MAERPAVNASPLIYLAGTDFLSLLQIAGPEIVVPGPAADEICAGGTADAAVRALESTPWLTVVEGPSVPAAIHAWDLGNGEASVLAWAHATPGTLAILDDLAARRCAATLRIPVRGTLGVVLAAKQQYVTGSQALGSNHAAKHRLWRRSLSDDDIRRLTGKARSQAPPLSRARGLDAVDVQVGWYALNEPELERIRGGEHGKTCLSAAEHLSELGLWDWATSQDYPPVQCPRGVHQR